MHGPAEPDLADKSFGPVEKLELFTVTDCVGFLTVIYHYCLRVFATELWQTGVLFDWKL